MYKNTMAFTVLVSMCMYVLGNRNRENMEVIEAGNKR